MVQHNIQDDGKTIPMRGVNKRLEIIRRPIGRMRRVKQYAVIAPATLAAKLRNGHHFNNGNAEFSEIRQLRYCGAEGAFRSERACMHLIHHGLLPTATFPPGVAPRVAAWINHI